MAEIRYRPHAASPARSVRPSFDIETCINGRSAIGFDYTPPTTLTLALKFHSWPRLDFMHGIKFGREHIH